MSILLIVAIVLAGWCAVSVVLAGLFSLVMRALADDPVPPRPTGLSLVRDDAA
jgi:hypothetical protein